jgi:hypothetical protein
MTAAERMRRMRERRKAAGLRPVLSWEPRANVSAPYSPHRLLDARSLAMHAVMAEKIERNPALIAVAHRNLQRWQERWGQRRPQWATEWLAILERSWPEIAALMTDPGEASTRLRQSSPFPGVLTVDERRRIYDAFRA